MDTRSRKSHKLAKVIIAVCVILPAVILVSLYPTMEEAMLEQKAHYEEQHKQPSAIEEIDWILTDDFVNYAVEASYYLYAEAQNASGTEVISMQIFQEYGWDSDFSVFLQNVTYASVYQQEGDGEPFLSQNADRIDDSVARFRLEFDGYGNVIDSRLEGKIVTSDNPIFYYEEVDFNEQVVKEADQEEIHSEIEASKIQFKNNLAQYNTEYEANLSGQLFVPKNFQLVVGLNEYSNFVSDFDWEYYGYWDHYENNEWYTYMDIGAYWIVLGCILFVILIALLLPFIRGLNTGREKLFSIPLELTACIAVGTVFLLEAMCMGMAYANMTWLEEIVLSNGEPLFLGKVIEIDTLYMLLRIAHTIGWSVAFFFVYLITANLRQFLCNPKDYLKYQTITAHILRWMKRKIKAIYQSVIDFDLNDNLNKSILKVVAVNFVILTILCCLWLFGVAGLLIYSVVLFVLIKKECIKIQKQYQSILHATEQMADGDLKISLEEELGVFEPIGESLGRVQQGFEKAVVEEAKSQNMKTELITNVSHDLKTPLTAIITYVDLLKKEDITEEERKSYIQTLDQKSQRLKVLIEDLFEVSKAHSGNVKMNFMDVDVVSLLKQVRSEMSEQIEESSLYFRWNLPEEKVILSLDGQKMYRVFENLINNILKYAMPYTRVYIDVIMVESQVQIRFRNVSAMELDLEAEKLTERFVRGDASRKSEGSGLGLAIAKSFVELQKGNFEIQVDGDLFKVLITFDK